MQQKRQKLRPEMGTILEPLHKLDSVLRSSQPASRTGRAWYSSTLAHARIAHNSTALVVCMHNARHITRCRETQGSTSPQPAPFAGAQERCRTADTASCWKQLHKITATAVPATSTGRSGWRCISCPQGAVALCSAETAQYATQPDGIDSSLQSLCRGRCHRG